MLTQQIKDRIEKEARSRNKEDAIGFGKFLKHLDNGTTHYNPETKETTGSNQKPFPLT